MQLLFCGERNTDRQPQPSAAASREAKRAASVHLSPFSNQSRISCNIQFQIVTAKYCTPLTIFLQLLHLCHRFPPCSPNGTNGRKFSKSSDATNDVPKQLLSRLCRPHLSAICSKSSRKAFPSPGEKLADHPAAVHFHPCLLPRGAAVMPTLMCGLHSFDRWHFALASLPNGDRYFVISSNHVSATTPRHGRIAREQTPKSIHTYMYTSFTHCLAATGLASKFHRR